MFVRLAFSVAVCVDPDILIVDEALAVGDEAFQRKCFARIEEMQDRGATILFVSHAAGMITQLCDRAVLLDRGQIVADGAPKAVIAQYRRLSHRKLSAPDFKAGTRVSVIWEFSCSLAPSTYFVNAGVSGHRDGERRSLHRIMDAFMFQVAPDDDDSVTGRVDFDIQVNVRRISA
jgi:ABC-type glutathione transport system ATPase component